MKIIFLDIDGVLASYVDMMRIDRNGPGFIKHAVDTLNKLISHTNAHVCISSAWRVGRDIEKLQSILDDRGVKCKVVGKTGNYGARGQEILDWFNDHPEYTEFIIIDDEMVDITPIIPYHWKTHIYTNPYRCLDIYDIGKITRKYWPEMENYKNRRIRQNK